MANPKAFENSLRPPRPPLGRPEGRFASLNIALYPHGGSANHGCEAIVRATAAILGGECPLTLLTSAPDEDRLYGLDRVCSLVDSPAAVKRLSTGWLTAKLTRRDIDEAAFSPVARTARKSRVVLSIGGDNYCYGINRHLLTMNRLARRTGVKSVLWGCSVEPDALADNEVRDDIAAFDVIVARESITLAALRRAGMQNVVLRPDPAFVLEPDPAPVLEGTPPTGGRFSAHRVGWRCADGVTPVSAQPVCPPAPLQGTGREGFALGTEEGAGVVGLNLSPLVMARERAAGVTLRAHKRLIEHILNETAMGVALIPHVVRAGDDDRDAMGALLKKFAHTGRVAMLPDAPAAVLKGWISRCRFFVASRTHASIAAYSSGVPTLVVGYSVKSRGIARDIFGDERGHVIPVGSLRGGGELIEAFEAMRAGEDSIRALLARRVPDIITAARAARSDVMRLIAPHQM